MTAHFNSVADHPALAMFANGCDGLDRTFEAVEGMPRARGNQVETLVIVFPQTSHLAIRNSFIFALANPKRVSCQSGIHGLDVGS